MDSPKPTILVVDDQVINTRLLQRRLERENMFVEVAYNGVECLEKVKENLPDVILLDVMMPEMDGIETCQRLKEDPETSGIPIIFITARTTQEGKIEGLESGAADYITKPVDLDETLARVNTQLRIRNAHLENMRLQQRINDIRRTAAIGSMTQGISHNLNNLMGVVVGYLDLLKQSSGNPEMAQRSVQSMETAIQRMVKLVRELSRISSEEEVPRTICQLKAMVDATLSRYYREYPYATKISINNTLPDDFVIKTNPETFEDVFVRVFTNAEDACQESETESEISMNIDSVKRASVPYIRIRINDNGKGIHPDIVETLFEPFVSTQTAVGRGLGLTLTRHFVRLLKGEIEVDPDVEKGASLVVHFPVA